VFDGNKAQLFKNIITSQNLIRKILQLLKIRILMNGTDLDIDGRIILKRIQRIWDSRMWTTFILLRRGPKADSCEHGNEISGSIKGGNFLTKRGTISFSRRITFHRVSYVPEERRDEGWSGGKERTMAT
jgi:hypothetical protein